MDRAAAERIEELERVVAELRQRLIRLAHVLPAEYLPYLDGEADEGDAARATAWPGVDDSTNIVRSDVEAELASLWDRTRAERS